jgi:hypothetical protein
MTRPTRPILAGIVLGLASDAGARSYAPRHRLSLHSIGLVGAAVIYPALRSGAAAEPAERQRELGGVLAGVVLTVLAVRSARRPSLLAAGWATHALFDAVHHRSESSLLPDWYPALCAGYDLALAGSLVHRRHAPPAR